VPWAITLPYNALRSGLVLAVGDWRCRSMLSTYAGDPASGGMAACRLIRLSPI